MDAAREGRVIAAGPSVAARRWPGFAEAARACGYQSFLSAPLFVGDGSATRGTSARGTEADGSVNVYGRDEDAFDDVDHARVRLLCATASAAIGGSRQLVRLTETIAALHRALESRAEIDQAIGVLAAVRGLSAEEAFSALVAESQRTNRKLHAVARDLMERTRAAAGRRPRGTQPAHR
jgi:hypothetical protein